MRSVFRRSGKPCLFDDGIKKVQQGLTTIEEVLRVTEVCSETPEAVPDRNSNIIQCNEQKSEQL
jgi:hypothetical protein